MLAKKTLIFRSMLIFIFLMLASLACGYVPTAEPTQTPLAGPTLEPLATPTVVTPTPPRPTATLETFTTVGAWNIREYPRTNAKVVAIANRAEVTIINYKNSWYYVRYGDVVGWIHEGSRNE